MTGANWSSANGGTETLSFAQTAAALVGSSVTVANVNPPDYDGTYTITAASFTSISFALVSSPPAYLSGGTVTYGDGSVPAGQIFVNPYLFPPSSPCANDGFKIVANYVRSLGLKFGLWLDASNNWNGEEIPGSFGPCSTPQSGGNCFDPTNSSNDFTTYDQEDAYSFASWGVSYVKADWAGNVAPPTNDTSGGATFDNQSQFESAPYNWTNNSQQMHEGIAQTMYGSLGQALSNASVAYKTIPFFLTSACMMPLLWPSSGDRAGRGRSRPRPTHRHLVVPTHGNRI